MRRGVRSERLARLGVTILAAATAVALAARGATVWRQVRFPWDLVIWSESPFMTDMLKLASGGSLFGPAADANGFVYAPGLAWLTHAVLAPFGVALDVRWCRVVSVVVGVLAAACATAVVRRARPDASAWLPFGVALLVVFGNPTADTPHPDDLFTLHALALLWACTVAVDRGDFRLAVVAAAAAGAGVLAKQTAFLTPVAVVAALAMRPWGARRVALLVAVAAIGAAVPAALLLGPPDTRFWTVTVMSRQEPWGTAYPGLALRLFLVPDSHPVLLAAAIAGAALWLRDPDPAQRRRARVWLCFGLAVLPAVAGYLKGAKNNLFVIDAWCVVAAWTALGAGGAAATRAPWPLRLAVSAAVLFAVTRGGAWVPTDGQRDYCEKLGAMVAADVRAHRRVLVAHGTTFLIDAGVREPPLDRANSVLELANAGLGDRAGTRDRLLAGWYDRVYLNSHWYDDAIMAALDARYRPTDELPSPMRLDVGSLNLFTAVRILDRR